MATTGGLGCVLSSLPAAPVAARAVQWGGVLKATEDERVVGRGRRRLGEGKRKADVLMTVRLRRRRKRPRRWCCLLLDGDVGGIALCVRVVCV